MGNVDLANGNPGPGSPLQRIENRDKNHLGGKEKTNSVHGVFFHYRITNKKNKYLLSQDTTDEIGIQDVSWVF